MAQTEIVLFERAGAEIPSPVVTASQIILQNAQEGIEVRVNTGSWVDLPRGATFKLPDNTEFSGIFFRSRIEQEVRITFDADVTNGNEILGSVVLENTELLRQITLNDQARTQLSTIINDALSGNAGADIDTLIGQLSTNITNALGEVEQTVEDNASGGDEIASLASPRTLNDQTIQLAILSAGRSYLRIYVEQGGDPVYLGSSNTVSEQNGFPVAPGFAFDYPGAGQVFATCNGSSRVRIMEVMKV